MSSLLNILGALIGFVSVTLLFSMVVTALVQASQFVLQMRARNLQRGLTLFVQNVLEVKDPKEAKDKAAKVLRRVAVDEPDPKPEDNIGLLRRKNIIPAAPGTTWVEPHE